MTDPTAFTDEEVQEAMEYCEKNYFPDHRYIPAYATILARALRSCQSKLEEAVRSEQFTQDWYRQRFERMDDWMRENAPSEVKNQYFGIQANGSPTPWEKPRYVETIHILKYRAEAAESKLSAVIVDLAHKDADLTAALALVDMREKERDDLRRQLEAGRTS